MNKVIELPYKPSLPTEVMEKAISVFVGQLSEFYFVHEGKQYEFSEIEVQNDRDSIQIIAKLS